MSTTKKSPVKNNLILIVLCTFILGFISGATFAVFKLKPATETPSQQASGQSTMDEQQKRAITQLESAVTKNPDDFQSWTQLGNLYYDTGQYQNSISAYNKSLELHSGNANIWTDLGVMYRRTQQPEKAVECFNTAINMDPNHQISRMNKGIVLMYDLKDVEGAIESWEGLLAINPDAKSGNGDSIREFVDQLKKDLIKKNQQ